MSKERIADLALFGGLPLFEQKLHVGRPNIGDRNKLAERLDDILDRRWLSNHGPYVAEFEQRVSDITGANSCVATCNGTLALEILIRAAELTGEVIVPAFTFVATAHALQWQQITPVLCDIELENYSLDPDQVERLIGPKTTGIIGVHLWGRPCDIDGLQKVADKHEVTLIFDAAHAFGCSCQGRMIGQHGRAEIFSFHATKMVNSFEGGAVVTSDDELATRIRLMKNFGFSGYDNVIHVGTNGKMSEFSAAMGLTSLDSLDNFIEVNRTNFLKYREGLVGIPGIRLLGFDEGEHCNYQYITLEVDAENTDLTRDELMSLLHAENVLARRYFYPGVHRMEPYRSLYPGLVDRLPNTEKATETLLCLPTGTAVGRSEIEKISDFLRFVVSHAHEIRARLPERR